MQMKPRLSVICDLSSTLATFRSLRAARTACGQAPRRFDSTHASVSTSAAQQAGRQAGRQQQRAERSAPVHDAGGVQVRHACTPALPQARALLQRSSASAQWQAHMPATQAAPPGCSAECGGRTGGHVVEALEHGDDVQRAVQPAPEAPVLNGVGQAPLVRILLDEPRLEQRAQPRAPAPACCQSVRQQERRCNLGSK